MKSHTLGWVCLLMVTAQSIGWTHDGDGWSSSRPDSHAPIGVMGDHTHNAGEWMVSYRFMRMDMDGHRQGTRQIGTENVLERYMVAPLSMTMDMHMLGAMYAPHDKLTLMVMVPFIDMSMDHRTRMGGHFTTESQGLGDISLSALWKIYDQGRSRIHLNLGTAFPTGAIDKRDDIPVMANAILPYPMQLGSGTTDLKPGITYLAQTDTLSWGSQFSARLPLGKNSRDYSWGNQIAIDGWLSRPLGERTAISLRLHGEDRQAIDGADPALNPNMVPTADPNLREGRCLDVGAGVNLQFPSGHRLALEVNLPVHQDLVGPQLETDWTLTAGWQKSW